MASPPFSIAETVPADDDVAANFPAAERTFRDIVESWLLIEHNTYGLHEFGFYTTAQRDAETNWARGSVCYNATLDQFQIATAADPETWLSIGPEFRTGGHIRMAFQHTNAPTGWTKVTDIGYNDVVMRLVTGVPSGQTTAAKNFSDLLTARTITQANLPAVNLVSSSLSAASSSSSSSSTSISHNAGTVTGSNVAEQNPNDVTVATPNGAASISATTTTTTTTTTTISGTVPLGGSGTAMDFAVNYRDFILAVKD